MSPIITALDTATAGTEHPFTRARGVLTDEDGAQTQRWSEDYTDGCLVPCSGDLDDLAAYLDDLLTVPVTAEVISPDYLTDHPRIMITDPTGAAVRVLYSCTSAWV